MLKEFGFHSLGGSTCLNSSVSIHLVAAHVKIVRFSFAWWQHMLK